MHPLVFLNDELIDAAAARGRIVSASSLYGRGVFTTLGVFNGKPFLWPEHFARLSHHAAVVGIDHDQFTEHSIEEALTRLIAANRVMHGRARVTLLDGADRNFWPMSEDKTFGPSLLITTGDQRTPPKDDGIALGISPVRINTHSPLAGIKSTNYLDHILAWEESHARGFDEAVMLNERGEIVSATMANVFWMKHGTLHTPGLVTGALAGITRAQVLAIADAMSIPHVEDVHDIAHLGDADEVFLTSSGIGVGVVTMFDYHHYSVPVGSLALRIREAYRQLTLDNA